MNGHWKEGNPAPDSHTVVHDVSLDEEFASSTIQEVEQPLLCGVRSVMPNVASAITGLLIEILFSIPCTVLHLGYAKTLAVDETHVFHVAQFVVGQSSSYRRK